MTQGFRKGEMFILICTAGGKHFHDAGEGGFWGVGAVASAIAVAGGGGSRADREGLFEGIVFGREEFIGDEVV